MSQVLPPVADRLLAALKIHQTIITRLLTNGGVKLTEKGGRVVVRDQYICLPASARRGRLELILELVYLDGRVLVKVYLVASNNMSKRIGCVYDASANTWRTDFGRTPTEGMAKRCQTLKCPTAGAVTRNKAMNLIGHMARLLKGTR